MRGLPTQHCHMLTLPQDTSSKLWPGHWTQMAFEILSSHWEHAPDSAACLHGPDQVQAELLPGKVHPDMKATNSSVLASSPFRGPGADTVLYSDPLSIQGDEPSLLLPDRLLNHVVSCVSELPGTDDVHWARMRLTFRPGEFVLVHSRPTPLGPFKAKEVLGCYTYTLGNRQHSSAHRMVKWIEDPDQPAAVEVPGPNPMLLQGSQHQNIQTWCS